MRARRGTGSPPVIAGAPTSIAAFVGHAAAGPVNEAVQVRSYADHVRAFGGHHQESALGHAVDHFFQNGGSIAWVVRAASGVDGAPPTDVEMLGVRSDKTGLYALETAPVFNVLNLPDMVDPAVLTAALAYAEERRSMMLIDMGPGVTDVQAAADWIADPAHQGLRRPNAVVYFPRVLLSDPLDEGRLRSFAASGAMAGLWARTDATRGVWKAPAGREATLTGVQDLDHALSGEEIGRLNPLGLNCLRVLPREGVVSWGARTLATDPEWRYLPVRRLALFVEQSLVGGLGFAVGATNEEPLWARIRAEVATFLRGIFLQGGLQGIADGEAYFVR